MGVVVLSSPPGAGQRSQAAPYSMDKETGNQDPPPPQNPTRFHISLLISPNNWTYFLLSCCQTQGFMTARQSCFIKQGRPTVAFHTIVRRRTRCIPTSDQALCQSGISKEKAVSNADSAPPISNPMQQEMAIQAAQKASNTRSKTKEKTL